MTLTLCCARLVGPDRAEASSAKSCGDLWKEKCVKVTSILNGLHDKIISINVHLICYRLQRLFRNIFNLAKSEKFEFIQRRT